jgi:DNA-binding SARP family transcriptional activator
MGDRDGDALRFEILGRLRVWRGGAELTLGSLQQRTVLAVLLLNANKPMARHDVIDAIWGPAAPAYAVNLLQKHISVLRRLLEPDRSPRAPSRVLRWTDIGYLLTAPAGCLDSAEFEDSAGRARVARATGDLDEAVKALRDGLRLWRGPLCDGLSGPLLDAERDRLGERRIDATEEYFDLELARGSGRDLIPELRRLVAQYPLRERLRALLMLALYHSGRQAEALAVFHEARQLLVGELGVEPGPQLRQAQQQILRASTARATPPSPGTLPPPAQLPYGLPHFAGREAELKRLDALCYGGRAVLITAIGGMAGVGKTALAVHWAHQAGGRFPDGQLYVNLRGFDPSGPPMEPAEAIRGFLDAFGVAPRQIPVGLPAQAALYRSLLAGRRMLIILDNAAAAEQVRPLLPGSPGCVVLVTSRDQLSGLIAAEGAEPLSVTLLPVPEAWELLARRLGEDRVRAEPDAVDDIIALCARLPLALAIVAARAATRPHISMAQLALELRDAAGGLDAFHTEDRSTDIRSVFSWSLERLSQPAQHTFRLLGLHPGRDFSTHSTASLTGVPPPQAAVILAELAGAQLVTELQPGRFTFHDLLGAYAVELVDRHETKAAQRTAVRRGLDHYLHTAFNAERLINPLRDPPDMPPATPGTVPARLLDPDEAMAWFSAEHAALLAAVDQAAAHEFDACCWRLAWAISTYLDRQAHWNDLATTSRTGMEAARRANDLVGRALSHRAIARAYGRQNRHDEEHRHLLDALALFEQLGDPVGQAVAHRYLAAMLEPQERDQEALGHATRALDLYTSAGHLAGRADALNAVGWFESRVGNHKRGLQYCLEALALHEELHDVGGQAQTWDSLGFAHHHMGDHETALTCYSRALSLFRTLGDRYNEAATLIRLGDAHASADAHEAARAAWRHALDIFTEIGHDEARQARARLNP